MKRSKFKFEPILLLVIGIPVATVIAGIFTIILAVQNRDTQVSPASPVAVRGVPIR
jgi:hypothetical protein